MNFIIDFWKWLKKLLTPPKAFSWQTLILLSIVSWLVSLIATDQVRSFVAFWGWIFLILGVWWGTEYHHLYIGFVSLSPWITGALTCIFIFGGWTNVKSGVGLVFWPIFSAIIAAVPEFVEKGIKWRIPPKASRQKLVILFGYHLLISCWIHFYFVLQNWLNQYPTLLADKDNFSKSAFVINLKTQQQLTPRGAEILNMMPAYLPKLDNHPCSDVQRQKQEKDLIAIWQQARKELSKAEEDNYWHFESKVSCNGSNYKLNLQAKWQGPSSDSQSYVITKLCEINLVTKSGVTPADIKINCSPATVPFLGRTPVGEARPKDVGAESLGFRCSGELPAGCYPP